MEFAQGICPRDCPRYLLSAILYEQLEKKEAACTVGKSDLQWEEVISN